MRVKLWRIIYILYVAYAAVSSGRSKSKWGVSEKPVKDGLASSQLEVHYMNVHKFLCWEAQPVEVPVPNLVFSVEIEDLGVKWVIFKGM